MAYNRSHSRYLRRGRFERARHSRRLLDYLDTQATRLAGTASSYNPTVQTGVATFTGDGSALVNTDTVTIGDQVYTFKTALTFAAAVGTFTNDGSAPANGSTVVIDGKTYTFQTVLTEVDGHVLIGSNTVSMTNLFHAINRSGGTIGIDYATATVAHATVTATNPSGTTVVVTAKTKGTAGNSIATTVAGTIHGSFGGATLASGADDVANEILRSGTAAVNLTNLFHAINASGGTAGIDYSLATVAHALGVATNPSPTTVVFTVTNPATPALATTTTAAHGSWGATTVAGSGTQFTATSHGLTDLDGPFVLTTNGTLPTGLALATEYWIHKVDANTIKFAKSKANAVNGTYVTISTNGSGTHTLKRATNRQGMYELLRRNSARAINAATDIDNLVGG
jgi:hypothetical protein